MSAATTLRREARLPPDFAEYAYLYERAWTAVREVRPLLAHIPTFLMLDDHEATDDWNAGLRGCACCTTRTMRCGCGPRP